MRKFNTMLLVIAMLLCCLAGISASAEEDAPRLRHDVIVLFTSDVHCGFNQGFTYAGLESVRDAAADAGNHVLLVDNGDSIQGEPIGILSRGQACIELMNAMGYDFVIPGNHEFDYGMDDFFALVEKAEFPYISCNFRKNGQLVFDPYIIREFDGVRIAFVGATTPETLTSSTPRYFQDENGTYIYDFTQGGDGSAFYAAVQKAVDDARAEGAAYVILMAHLGNSAASAPYTYADVIAHTNGIDAVLDGHSHDSDKVFMKNKDGEMIVRQACGTKLGSIGRLRISAADGTVNTDLITWTNADNAQETLGIWNHMAHLTRNAIHTVENQLSLEVGFSAVKLVINDPTTVDENGIPIRIVRRAETNMGDLCADAFREISGADVAVMNGGSFRAGLPEGRLTLNDIMTVLPFGNPIMMTEATGQQILDALEWGARVVPEENGAFLQVSGMTYEIHTYIESTCQEDKYGMFTGVAGERRVRNVMIGGEPLDPDKTYTIASLSYVLIENGDGQTALAGGSILWQGSELDYRILADYIEGTLNGVISEEYTNPYGQGRIIAVPKPPET